MKEYQQRVIDEKSKLDEKIVKLLNFCRGDVFASLPSDERVLLNRQYEAMEKYRDILQERIKKF